MSSVRSIINRRSQALVPAGITTAATLATPSGRAFVREAARTALQIAEPSVNAAWDYAARFAENMKRRAQTTLSNYRAPKRRVSGVLVFVFNWLF